MEKYCILHDANTWCMQNRELVKPLSSAGDYQLAATREDELVIISQLDFDF